MKKVLTIVIVLFCVGNLYAGSFEKNISSAAQFIVAISSSYFTPLYTACNSTTDFKVPSVSSTSYMGENDAGTGWGYALAVGGTLEPNFDSIFKVDTSSVNFRGVFYQNLSESQDIWIFDVPTGIPGNPGANGGIKIEPEGTAKEDWYDRESWAILGVDASTKTANTANLGYRINLLLKDWNAR